jgi:hypothetical protein
MENIKLVSDYELTGISQELFEEIVKKYKLVQSKYDKRYYQLKEYYEYHLTLRKDDDSDSYTAKWIEDFDWGFKKFLSYKGIDLKYKKVKIYQVYNEKRESKEMLIPGDGWDDSEYHRDDFYYNTINVVASFNTLEEAEAHIEKELENSSSEFYIRTCYTRVRFITFNS